MRKLLSILSAVILTSSATTSIIACGVEKSVKIDISDKIGDSIDLGQLSANTIVAFKNNLQTKLIARPYLEKITISDYVLYKADSTINITDSDVASATSLKIKIVAKGNKFMGFKYNVNVSYINDTNLKTIIASTNLDSVFISKKVVPDKSDILKAIKIKNPTASSLKTEHFNFEGSVTINSVTIVGTGKFTGKVTLSYNTNNFLSMTGTTGKIYSVATSNDGIVYAGGEQGRLYRSDGTGSFVSPSKKTPILNQINSLTTDNNGTIFAASSYESVTNKDNFYKSSKASSWENTEFTKITSVPSAVSSLITDQNGDVYAGTAYGIFKLPRGQENFRPWSDNNWNISALAVDRLGSVVALGTDGTIYKKYWNNESFEILKKYTDASVTPNIHILEVDNYGAVYVVSNDAQSLYKWNGQSTTEFIKVNGIFGKISSLKAAKDFSATLDGTIYIGTTNGTVYKNAGTEGSVTFTQMIGTSGVINDLRFDKKSRNLYVVSDKGVYRT